MNSNIPDRFQWHDDSSSDGKTIKHSIENGSVLIIVRYVKEKWYMRTILDNVMQVELFAKNEEDAKQEAIAISRKYAETLLEEICSMEE